MSILNLQSAFGLAALVGIAWLLSEDRRNVRLKVILVGVFVQIGLALLLLKVDASRQVLLALNGVVEALQGATQAGTSFVFGYVGGGSAPFSISSPENFTVLAFQVLPLVLVISALSALLWHWRILPFVISGFSRVLQRAFGLSGAVGLGAAANVFMGMIESPLLIKPYLRTMSRSELFVVLTTGLATVAGSVLVLYATMLRDVIPMALGHILTASIVSVPAAIVVAKIMIPGNDSASETANVAPRYEGAMDALTQGTQDGLKLYLNIVAMLLVIVALVALANIMLGVLPDVGGAPLTFERLLGWGFAPIAWLIGVPWSEAADAGALMGLKTILNELVAYLQMARLEEGVLSPRSELILVYALCGFANLGSVGIMIGGVTGLVPERRTEVLSLSVRALISGSLATFMTGAVVGLITF